MTTVQSDQTKIAVIANDISNIKGDISDIKIVLKEGYATKDNLTQVAKDTERRLNALEILATTSCQRLDLLEMDKTLLQGGWKTMAIAGGVLVAVTALVLNAIRLFRAGL